VTLEPLYRAVPAAHLRASVLHQIPALVDALRPGRVGERRLVEQPKPRPRSAGRSSRIATLLVGLALTARVLASVGQSLPTANYVIGPKDVLSVTIYGEPDLNHKTYTVDADGMFSFPMIGRIRAAGLSVAQLEQALRKRLVPDYFRDPQISISIDQYLSKQIIVAGEVARPGPQPFTGGMTLLGVLARAGGVASSAAGEVLVAHEPGPGLVTDAGGSEREARGGGDAPFDGLRIDLTKLQAGALELDVEIRDGDTILVPRAESAFVVGEVRNPGAYAVLKSATLQRLLSLAGGLTPRASQGRISIDRDGKTLKKVKLTEIVKPGDTINVPSRMFWR
jgi:polysaccharide biosynthesis/export protein